MQKSQIVYYTNAIPGSGKTHWAVQKIIEHLSNDSTDVILYCAPTIQLLRSVYDTILENLPKNCDASSLKLICSDTSSDINDYLAASFKNLSVFYESTALRNSKLSDDVFPVFNSTAIRPGNVVFITHAAFWNANFRLRNNTFKLKKRITLIIDEARDCYISSVSFCINDIHTAQKFKKYLNFSYSDDFAIIDPIKLSKNFLRCNGFHEYLFDSGSINVSVIELLDKLSKKSNVDLYVFCHSDTRSHRFILSVIRAPYEALYGWKNVYLLSAFYEYSQLYHMLKSANSSSNSKYTYSQINITDEVIDKTHLEKIKTRLKNTTISWVYDSPVSFSKYRDCVPAKVTDVSDIKDMVYPYQRLLSLFLSVPEYKQAYMINNTKLAEFVKEFLSATCTQQLTWDYEQIIKSRLNRLFSAFNETSEDFKSYSSDVLKDVYSYIFDNQNALIPFNGTTLASLYAYEIISRSSKSTPQFLLSINNRNPNKVHSHETIISKQESIETSQSNMTANWMLNVPAIIQSYAIPLRGNPSGLNTYKQHDYAAILSSYLPPPDLIRWFNRFCPSYDANNDFNLGQTIQVMMRCSVRDSDSTTSPLIVLNSKTQANRIKGLLYSLPNLLDPCKLDLPKVDLINIDNYEHSDSIKQKSNLRVEKHMQSSTYYITKVRNLLDVKQAYFEYLKDTDLCDLYRKSHAAYTAKNRYAKTNADYENDEKYIALKAKYDFLNKEYLDAKQTLKQTVDSLSIDSLHMQIKAKLKDFRAYYIKRVKKSKDLLKKSTIPVSTHTAIIDANRFHFTDLT